MTMVENVLKDVTEPLTGAKAAEEAQRKAQEDAEKARVESQQARVFAETEGQGTGHIGEVVFGIDDEEEDELTDIFKL